MSKFHFDETVMDNNAAILGALNTRIDVYVSELEKNSRILTMQKGFSVEDIFSDLSAEKDKLKYCGERIGEGIAAVHSFKGIISKHLPVSENSTPQADNKNDEGSFKEMVYEMVHEGAFGKMGPIGGSGVMIGSSVADIISGKDCTGGKYISGVLKSGVGVLKGLYGAKTALSGLEKVSVNDQIKALFGYGFTKKSGSDLSLGKEFSGGFNTVSNILTFVSRAFNNAEEYESGKISEGRAIAETVVETGIKIAGGWAVKTGLALALGTPVGWGAVAVAAGAGAITVGANYLCKYLYKKVTGEEMDIVEAASDFYIDTAAAIGKGAKKVGDAVVGAAKSLVSSISQNISFLGRGFRPLWA